MVGLERGTVELEPHNPAWRDTYEAEVERLQSLVGEHIEEFQHVGSTAVEGLPAKPVIDFLAVVDESVDVDGVVDDLERNGYELRPSDDVPDRVFLAKGPPSERTHYLSLVEHDSECYREQVAFRDYLRAHPDVAADYGDLKRELAVEYADDRSSYTAEKSEFVERVLPDARNWQE